MLRLLAVALSALLVGLGIWQLERRAWKLDLIARIEARVHAPPVAAPGPQAWTGISAASDEYRRVRATGTFLNDRETLVKAVTERGGGFWVVTPLKTDAGFTVLVNRGFVPPDEARAARRTSDPSVVVGLMRMSEPKGGFLRANDPAGDRWYSRDVPAIAQKRGVPDAAPYFIDAEASGGGPQGGLTIIDFPNNHLIYALTWFGLAVMVTAGLVFI
ncbi:SURF1 family protein [Roseixanthobacter glucoisosaccharinicivorans]|uniref:SURF1 family protein n=1 Tax=Roseixanthobacter glucoisosaccharinicivorans TaxID=3119923 RepID=UPI003727D513